jgi:glycosyltransferase involved in cell wall biosynthesis
VVDERLDDLAAGVTSSDPAFVVPQRHDGSPGAHAPSSARDVRVRRLLHVCDFHLKYATGVSRGLADHGHDVTLLTRDHDLEFGGRPGAMRDYVARRGGDVVRHAILPGRTRDAAGLRAAARLRRRLRSWRPDVVHFQESVGTDLRLLLAAGVPWGRYADTVHDPAPHPGETWPLVRRETLRILLRGAGVVFVHSDVLRDALLERARPKAPVVVVPHGIDPPQVAPMNGSPSLLFFGRISTYYKGLDVLLDAMPRVWERVPEATLTIAGAGEVAEHPLLGDARVVLRNEHIADDEVPGMFAASTCCVLPYREASQSGVGSRAKSYGRAIVATDVGGLPELVTPDCGRIVTAGDSEALAMALVEVLTTPGLAESMGRAAAADVAAAGWDRVAEMTLDAYERHLLREP